MMRSTLCTVLACAALAVSACTGTATTESGIDDTDGAIADADLDGGSDSGGGDVQADDAADSRDARDADAKDADAADSDTADSGDTEPEDAGRDAESIGSEGCVSGTGLPEGESTFTLEGRTRRFIVRLPNGYTGDRAWPVVLALHGNGGSAQYWDETSGSRNIRGVLQDDAILIIAEAIDGQWRDYSADSSTWPARIESELLYFDHILTQARAELCIDEDAIFSMGFSGGGSFSGVLGCRRTDIRAIAAGGSVIYFDQANCVGTPAAWITIGTEELSDARRAYRDYFRDRAGCAETSMTTEPVPCVAYEACGQETPVHYCQHPDGHIWPDFASEAMWAFFEPFTRAAP